MESDAAAFFVSPIHYIMGLIFLVWLRLKSMVFQIPLCLGFLAEAAAFSPFFVPSKDHRFANAFYHILYLVVLFYNIVIYSVSRRLINEPHSFILLSALVTSRADQRQGTSKQQRPCSTPSLGIILCTAALVSVSGHEQMGGKFLHMKAFVLNMSLNASSKSLATQGFLTFGKDFLKNT